MKNDGRTFNCNLRVGDELSLDAGRIIVRLVEKSGRQARLAFEFVEHIEVQRRPVAGAREESRGSLTT